MKDMMEYLTTITAAAAAMTLVVGAAAGAQQRMGGGGTPDGGASLSAFLQSFEVSVDGQHWGKSVATSIACAPGNSAACLAHASPITVYTRWSQMPPVDMTVVHNKYPSLTEPYRVQVEGSNPRLCTMETTHHPNASSGYPVSITPSGEGAAFPIVCHWDVLGVSRGSGAGTAFNSASTAAAAYMAYPSNTATVTVTLAPVRAQTSATSAHPVAPVPLQPRTPVKPPVTPPHPLRPE